MSKIEKEISRLNDPDYHSCAVIIEPAGDDYAVRFATRQFYEATGYAEEEVVGKRFVFIDPHRTNPDDVARLLDVLESGRPANLEIVVHARDGSSLRDEMTIRPVSGEGGAVDFITVYQIFTREQGAA